MATLKTLWKNRNLLILTAMILAFVFHLFKTQKEICALSLKAETKPFVLIGAQFEGIKTAVEGESRMGYYTDQSLDNRFHAAQFSQAQYLLAPIILELNSIDHPFVIFDYKEKKFGIQKIQALGLSPISMSPSGIILTKNPKFK